MSQSLAAVNPLDALASAKALTRLSPSLSAAACEHYWAEGYLVVKSLFDAKDLTHLRQACDDLCTFAAGFREDSFHGHTFFNMFRDTDPFAKDINQVPVKAGIIRRVTYPYALNETFNTYRCHPPLLAAVASLLGEDLVQVVNQVNFNHPGGSSGWGWHQDYRFRKAGIPDPRRDFVQTLLAIDTCSLLTGGLRLVPRSYELGMLSLDKDPDKAETYFDATRAITPELAPGDVIFFNPLMIHGSTPNRSPHQRRVYINGYARASIPFGMPVLTQGMLVPHTEGRMEYEGDRQTLPKASKY